MLSLHQVVTRHPLAFLGPLVNGRLPLANLQFDWCELHAILQQKLTNLTTLEIRYELDISIPVHVKVV